MGNGGKRRKMKGRRRRKNRITGTWSICMRRSNKCESKRRKLIRQTRSRNGPEEQQKENEDEENMENEEDMVTEIE